MFADDDYTPASLKQTKGNKKKKDGKQKQVQFAGRAAAAATQNNSTLPSRIQADIQLQNQIQAAQVAETLIDELRNIENNQTTEISDLKNSCTSLSVHAQTLMEEKRYLVDKVGDLSKVNDDLKRKFSALLDQFQEYVTMQENKQADDEQKQKA